MRYSRIFGFVFAASIAISAFVGGTATATTLEAGGVAKNSALSGGASLASGTSAILKDSLGTTTDTCTESVVEGKTEGTFTGATVGGKLSKLTFGKCTHTTTVLANGSFSIAWTSGTNGTVSSSGAEVTVVSTAFGASAVCKSGAGTAVGTVTGTKEGNATIDLNGKVSCGILGTATITGTYTTTGGKGVGVTS